MIVRCTSDVPPAIDAAFDHSHCRCQKPPPGLSSAPHHSGAAAPTTSSARGREGLGHVGPRELRDARLRARARCPSASRDSVRQLCSRSTRSSTNDCASASAISTSSSRSRSAASCVELVEVHLVHDLLLERERGAPLVRERRVRDRPAVVQPADEVVVGHEHLVEEHLVELGLAGDLHERPHLDARRLHVDDEVRDAPVLRHVGVGAGEADPPPRELRVRRPHLLPREQPAVVDAHGLRLRATRGRSRRRAR